MAKTNFSRSRRVLRRRFIKMFGWYEMIARLLLLCFSGVLGDNHPPPNYAHNMMPNTTFSCDGKATGGYYADPEAGCQVFHVCVRVGPDEIQDFEFLCPNNTIFDQQNFICANHWEIDCQSSTKHYSKNDLFKVAEPTTTLGYDSGDDSEVIYEYEVVIEYDDELDDGSVKEDVTDSSKHRFNGPRTGKSQYASSHLSNNTIKSTTITDASTSSMYTSTKSRITFPYTEVTTPTTVTAFKRTTTPKITTLRPAYRLPFKPAFSIGKPVVSVSSTTSYEVSYTTTEYPLYTTKLYGISTTNQVPISTDDKQLNLTSTTSRSTKTETTSPSKVNSEYEEIISDIDEDSLSIGVEDPFANYDWKKDNSQASVTSSLRTRYETRFGTSYGRNSKRPASSIPTTERYITPTRITTIVDTSTKQQNFGSHTYRRRRKSRKRGSTTRLIPPPPEHRAFSNFRYYRTAFGRSESVTPFNSTEGAFTEPQLFPNARSYRSFRPEKTASYNTRYSKYG